MVLGALLLVVILLFVSCGGEDDGKGGGDRTAATQTPTPGAAAGSTPDTEPSYEDEPGPGPSLPDPADLEQPGGGTGLDPSAGANGGQNGTGNDANVTVPTDGSCADSEMSVTPVPAATSIKRGASVVIKLKVKNISTRACTRDLGAGAQELYIDQGARKFWSSDGCSSDRSANAQRLQPGAEMEYSVTWNGRQSNKCASALAAGPNLPPGQFELRARLGTKVSEPVLLTVA